MQAPTTNPITQGRHGRYNAVDYSAKDANRNWNKTFYAPEDGKITAYGASGTCGNRLELTAGSNRHGFCHLERSLVSVGQWVKKGQAIGVMGYTGYTIPSGINGSHLHWVINRNGTYIYPPSLINETGGTEVFSNETEVQQAYQMLRGKNATSAEVKGWIGQPQQRFFIVGKPEADGFRAQYANLERNFVIVRNERDQARKEKAALIVERDRLDKELAIMTADRDKLSAELSAAKEAFTQLQAEKEKELASLNEVIQAKDDEIIRLTKELENCSGDLSWSQHLVLGIKGLLAALNPLNKGE